MTRIPHHTPRPAAFGRIESFDEIDSTNSEATRRAVAGERGPLWISADVQTRGKGRMGRSWSTPSGNLAATLLFVPDCPPQALPQLSLLAGVAAFDGIASGAADEVPSSLRLKWPNDLLIGTAKLGGILVECANIAGTTVAFVGIGINVAHAPPTPGRSVTSLLASGATTTPGQLLERIDRCMSACLGLWDRGAGFAEVRQAWTERAGPLGEAMSVNTDAGRLDGTYAGLDDDGALLMRDAEGHSRRITFGDVSVGPTGGKE